MSSKSTRDVLQAQVYNQRFTPEMVSVIQLVTLLSEDANTTLLKCNKDVLVESQAIAQTYARVKEFLTQPPKLAPTGSV